MSFAKTNRLSAVLIPIFLCALGLGSMHLVAPAVGQAALDQASDNQEDDSVAACSAWERVTVPGAKCGDGGEYSVFIRRGDPKKVAVAMMGGGACWDESSCLGLNRRTYLSMIPFVPIAGGFVSQNPRHSPVAGWTTIYFPYCTGDLFAANHVARYGRHAVHHVGRAIVPASFERLMALGKLSPQGATDLVVWGPSAGALGAMIHARYLDAVFNQAERKALIADAPGLHFGSNVWNKFSPKLLEEFALSMKEAGLDLRPGQGVIAEVIPGLCRVLPHWSIGVLQGSRDIIMSQLFGEVRPEEHRQAILSDQGVLALTADPRDLCRSWVPDTYAHTFLPTPVFAGVKAQGVSATEFMMKVVARELGPNYADAFQQD